MERLCNPMECLCHFMERLYINPNPMKKNFALRVDAEVFEALERWAADEFRSVNGQIEWILSTSLKKAGRMPKKKAEKPEGNDSQGN